MGFYLKKTKPVFSEGLAVVNLEILKIQTALTPQARSLGLSNRETLDPFDGLLLVFKESDYHGVWMKDMNFPLDIIWLDQNGKVVHLEKTIQPQTYPQSFKPEKKASFVLELKAGKIDQLEIKNNSIFLLSY